MADSDYIGNLSTSRWQSMNASYLNRTPSWMQGEFKQGNRTQQNKYQAPNAGVQQAWRGGEIRDTRTKPGATAEAVNAIGQGFVSRNLNRQAQAQQAQQSQQAGQNFYSQYVGLANRAQYQAAFQKAPAPALPTKPLPSPAPGVQPFGTPSQNQAFPAPGTPAPARPPLTPLQQSAIAGVQQMKAQRTAPAKTPAKTRSQRRSMGTDAINKIRASLNEQNTPDFLK